MPLRETLRQAPHPQLLGFGAKESEVAATLVCSDVAGFTRMTERLGDRHALRVMQRHDEIIRHQVSTYGGTALELRGDGFLLTFPEAARGLLCSVAIQRAFEVDRIEHPGEEVEIRVGVHAGRVMRDGKRFFGRNVIVAFRITEVAGAGEILTTSKVKAQLSNGMAPPFHEGRDLLLKGFSAPFRVYSVGWHEAALLSASRSRAQRVPRICRAGLSDSPAAP